MPVTEKQVVALNLRLPSELHRELVRLAQAQDRTLNAQIVRFLRRAVGQKDSE